MSDYPVERLIIQRNCREDREDANWFQCPLICIISGGNTFHLHIKRVCFTFEKGVLGEFKDRLWSTGIGSRLSGWWSEIHAKDEDEE